MRPPQGSKVQYLQLKILRQPLWWIQWPIYEFWARKIAILIGEEGTPTSSLQFWLLLQNPLPLYIGAQFLIIYRFWSCRRMASPYRPIYIPEQVCYLPLPLLTIFTFLPPYVFALIAFFWKEIMIQPKLFPSSVHFFQKMEWIGPNISSDILTLRDRKRLDSHSKAKSW